MAKVTVRFLIEKTNANGETRRYWQPPAYLRAEGWPTVPLRNDQGRWMNQADAIKKANKLSQEVDEWREGIRRNPSVPERSLDALIDHYERSARYKRLMPKTQADYKYHLNKLAIWMGDEVVIGITPPAVQAYYEALYQDTPAAANGRIRVLRLLLQHGVRIGWLTSNAASMPGLIRQKSNTRIWSEDEIDVMVAAADELKLYSIGTLIRAAAWLGHYPIDLINMTRNNYDGERFTFRRQKTDNPISVPDNDRLRTRLTEQLARQLKIGNITPTTLIVNEKTGRAYSQSAFNKSFAQVRAHAAKQNNELEKLEFRTLRHTAVTRMAEDGLTAAEIASFTGHSLKQVEQILDVYLVRTGALADAGAKKRRQ